MCQSASTSANHRAADLGLSTPSTSDVDIFSTYAAFRDCPVKKTPTGKASAGGSGMRDEGTGAGGEKNGGRARGKGGKGGGRAKGKGKGRKGSSKSTADPVEESEDLNEGEEEVAGHIGGVDTGVCAVEGDTHDQLALVGTGVAGHDATVMGGSVGQADGEEAVEGGAEGGESSGSLVQGATSGIGGYEVSGDSYGGGQSMEITYDESDSASVFTIPLDTSHLAPDGSERDSVQEKKRRRVCVSEDLRPDSVPMAVIPGPTSGTVVMKHERGVHGEDRGHTLAVRAHSKDSEDRGDVTAQEGGGEEESDEDRMVQCNECFRWVHALCEGIDQSQYEAMTRGTHPVWVRELTVMRLTRLIFV